MDIPVELLDRALAMYREDLERRQPADPEFIKHQLSVEIKPALPEEVRDFLEVLSRPDGGHSFWLNIPGCVPISLSFTRRISGLELRLAFVMNEETRKQWSSSNVFLAIGYARDLYLQSEEIGGVLLTSDIGIRLSK